jgi:regulator of protease activity HflC (stomatin/prohibitin superfamily)
MNAVLLRVGGGVVGRALLRTWYRTHRGNIVLAILLTIFIVTALWEFIAKVIPAGHVGVEWHRFAGGTDTETVYEEGTRFILPWNKMAVYDARLQQFNHDFDVLTRDGLMMTVNIAVRFRLNQAAVGLLHKHVGPAYVDTLLVPTVGSFARIVFSQNSTDEIYTDRRIAVQAEIKRAVLAELDHYLGQGDGRNIPWLFLDDVLIRSMRFPPEVASAVNRKMEQYQLREEYSYRLEREKLESERKEIEARGIALFQNIVGSGISDTYLRWKGIDATLALARSPNAKIIVVGTGKDGLPLILGGLDQSPNAVLQTEGRDKTATQNSGPDPKTSSSTITPSSLSEFSGSVTPSE